MSHPLLGFHLFLPLERMQVVELVSGPEPDPALLGRAGQLAERLGRRVVQVRDGQGYAASRMALAQGLEAMRILESGAACAEDLDTLMVMGYGHPVGPLELSDRIGLDLRLAIARGIFEESSHPAFRPPPILESLVEQGHLGVKTGQGFHPWPRPGALP
jgi:3-hydroxybutyryl-CoA dehydrogenase